MDQSILEEAMCADNDELISASPDEIRAVAQQGFFDGIRTAAALVDDPATEAKLWALMRDEPDASPNDETMETTIETAGDLPSDDPIPEYAVLNDHGLCCDICGYHVTASWNMEDDDYTPPENCPNCGAPDDFNPDKV